jgi:hypothetical protein
MSQGIVTESVKQASLFARRKLLTDELLLIVETGCMFVGGPLIAPCGARKFYGPIELCDRGFEFRSGRGCMYSLLCVVSACGGSGLVAS